MSYKQSSQSSLFRCFPTGFKSLCPCLLMLAAAVAPANAVSLIERSPFVRPDFDMDAAPSEGANLSSASADYEFHGVYELDGDTHVLLKAKSDGTFTWYTVGTRQEGLIPKFYDADNDELVILMDNNEVRLTLQQLGEFKPIPVASGPSRSGSNPAVTRSNRPQRASPLLGSNNRSGVSSIVRRLPRSPTGSLSQGNSRSRATLEQMRPIINSSNRTAPETSPDASLSPESKPPRGAPSLPFDFPTPPKGPGG